MAPVTVQSSRLLRKVLCGLFLLFGVFMVQSTAFGFRKIGVAPWRPLEAVRIPSEPNEAKAGELIEKLTYSTADADHICDITLALEPNEATIFLQDYIAKYSKENQLTDNTWGRAVFCLGLVQTEEAKNELLRLWDIYDQRLASGQIKVRVRDVGKSLPPLGVIGDALHFYLWDGQIRQWFIRRIKEAEKLPKGNYLEFAKSSRRSNRFWLLRDLYRWDIIESVDNEPVVTPEKLTGHYPFANRYAVKNISRSAENVVYWVKKLQPLHADITKEQWMKIRSSEWEYRLDSVAIRLGKTLALALWNRYLEKNNTDISSFKHRLWLISLWTYLHHFIRMPKSLWTTGEKDNLFLRDATAYVAQLPDGHIRKLSLGALFKISCYAPEYIENEQIKQIRELSNKFLSENERKGIIRNVENNKRAKKRIEQNK